MMRTLIYLTVAMAGIFNVNASTTATQPLSNHADSLGYYIGVSQGSSFGRHIATQYSGQQLDRFREGYLDGLREALSADTARLGYTAGLSAGLMIMQEFSRLHSLGYTVNSEEFIKAFTEFFTGKRTLSDEEYAATYKTFSRLMQPIQKEFEQRQKAMQQASADKAQQQLSENIAKGEKFLSELRANDPEVKTTTSGLSYKVIRQGEGPTVQPEEYAMVLYTGRHTDGTQFDASRGEPVRLSPQQVIKGFGEGLQLMNRGSKYILYIPYNLAYGEQGTGPIGPGETLVFEIEVTDILTPGK